MPIRLALDTDECKRARILAGLNLRQAADQIDVTATHLGFIESGTRGPSPAVLKRMAEVYGVPMETLLGDTAGAA